MTSPASVPNPEYPAESEQPSTPQPVVPERHDDLREDPEPLEAEAEAVEDEGEDFEEDDEPEDEEESPDSNEQESREP